MPLKHTELWNAIDLLAKKHRLSPSGLAKKAGLSPTVFNLSKRTSDVRKRWPSTESIAKILQVTATSLEDFVGLAASGGTARSHLPLLAQGEVARADAFDDEGYPTAGKYEEVRFPDLNDPHAFMIEIAGENLEPVYRDGDRIVLSPASKPRRGDRVVVRTKENELLIGRLGRQAGSIELIALNRGAPGVNIAQKDADWVYRIVWASQ